MVHTLAGWRDICMQKSRQQKLMLLSHTREKPKCCLTVHPIQVSKKAVLTLCFHSISDRTGITQPVGIGCPYQEEVDCAGLQALQYKWLSFHMLCQGLPAAPWCMTADTQQRELRFKKSNSSHAVILVYWSSSWFVLPEGLYYIGGGCGSSIKIRFPGKGGGGAGNVSDLRLGRGTGDQVWVSRPVGLDWDSKLLMQNRQKEKKRKNVVYCYFQAKACKTSPMESRIRILEHIKQFKRWTCVIRNLMMDT